MFGDMYIPLEPMPLGLHDLKLDHDKEYCHSIIKSVKGVEHISVG